MGLPRLITITFSHYCEKARWALEHAEVAFTEEAYPPPFHATASWRAGGRRTVPVLVADDGVFADSSDIVQWADRKAPPERRMFGDGAAERREIETLEEQFDKVLGPHARRGIYFYVLPRRAIMMQLAAQGAQPWQTAMFTLMLPVVCLTIRKSLRIDAASAARSFDKVRAIFDQVGEKLADGRPFLVGQRLSAADITFASLAAPLLLPARFGARLPPVTALPPEAASLIHEFRAHPAGAWALRIYEQHRGA
ncbi:glutathione S-transferase family protein [Chondromyces apiculatus]|uniref:Glutathione S-transferase family protein n=1 Tax=Chondromyces apiculatus DSM 436 TaxID=1192034 RepID=A0A017T6G9_9BACT|nr:glutathione S-transferase family protein [Chondromyces apiculatus]EYF04166.1 Glutathione S-transferase family protein [Chondromyces apiculatus DSM 436]